MVIVLASQGAAPLLPPFAVEPVSKEVTDQLYERLAEIGPEMNTVGDRGFQPRLARSWSWSPDSLSVAFSIDPSARWHDGRPVRASDVRFTFNLLKDPKTATQITPTIANVDSITMRDSMTAVAWFHRRTPEQFFDVTYQMHVLPEHVLRDTPRDKLSTSEVLRTPIGSGRFRFGRYDQGVRIELLADTGHYRGRPKLDRVIWSLVQDGNTAITQLLSGQADFLENLPAQLVPRVDSTRDVRAFRYPGSQYAFMAMNLRDPRRLAAPHPTFGDVRVRRAVSMALDREAMLRNVFDTLGVLGKGPYPTAYADTTIAVPPFDRAWAAALLDSAGWRAGADGQRAKNGRPLAFGLIVPTSSPPRMRYAVLIQEQLKSVGVRVNIESMDFPAFTNRQETRNFDATLGGVSVDPNLSSAKQDWGAEFIGGGGRNYVGYNNPAFDKNLDSALTTFDPARSKEYSRRAHAALVADAPAVWLYDLLAMAGLHKRIRPEGVRADGWWVDLAEWWIPADERIERDRIGLRPAQP